MESSLAQEIILNALLMPMWRPKPTTRILVDSDQESQYGSDDWLRFSFTSTSKFEGI
ncbi:hypothetical protein ACP7H9_08280 [Idiomarina sp. ST20R2A10]|nr:hypothetical protein DEU30_11430 [Idiomarina sp. 017G]